MRAGWTALRRRAELDAQAESLVAASDADGRRVAFLQGIQGREQIADGLDGLVAEVDDPVVRLDACPFGGRVLGDASDRDAGPVLGDDGDSELDARRLGGGAAIRPGLLGFLLVRGGALFGSQFLLLGSCLVFLSPIFFFSEFLLLCRSLLLFGEFLLGGQVVFGSQFLLCR